MLTCSLRAHLATQLKSSWAVSAAFLGAALVRTGLHLVALDLPADLLVGTYVWWTGRFWPSAQYWLGGDGDCSCRTLSRLYLTPVRVKTEAGYFPSWEGRGVGRSPVSAADGTHPAIGSPPERGF